ncbi:MAG TPA: DUF742 domain-containing protein [Streptosporangiaceae bacterium]|nr:DUF742 domain-containing protein [Streptosporangiaceae bacterium]
MGAESKWVGRNAGPVVRPYAVTGGRTEPADGEVLDLITVVVQAGPGPTGSDPIEFSPEHRRIVNLCRRPATVADVASDTALPIGVVRVLLADLIQSGRVKVQPQRPAGQQPSTDLLREVLHGLRAL